jgi:hypothetical protein
MKKLLLIAGAMLLMVANASADDYSAADIAKLPQDKVVAIRRECAKDWGDNFRMREYCEDRQYEALQTLIDRGSVKPNGARQ